MSAKIGGVENWEAAKEIRWEHKYFDGENVKQRLNHYWDRWNGRHRFELYDMASLREAAELNEPKKIKVSAAAYDLFNPSKGFATHNGREVSSSQARDMIGTAQSRFKPDSYQLTMIHKLKDPGVVLKYAGQAKNMKDGLCSPACDTIRVSFDKSVGSDIYYVNINTETKMPEYYEIRTDRGQLGYHLKDWTEVGGLKFPQTFQNIGLKDEVFKVANLKVGDPDDFLYIKRVRH